MRVRVIRTKPIEELSVRFQFAQDGSVKAEAGPFIWLTAQLSEGTTKGQAERKRADFEAAIGVPLEVVSVTVEKPRRKDAAATMRASMPSRVPYRMVAKSGISQVLLEGPDRFAIIAAIAEALSGLPMSLQAQEVLGPDEKVYGQVVVSVTDAAMSELRPKICEAFSRHPEVLLRFSADT